MAKKSTSKAVKTSHTFAIGDRVEILRFGRGKVVELRGPLGPGGAHIYRVVYSLKPKPAYIEVLGSQLRLRPAKPVKQTVPVPGDTG